MDNLALKRDGLPLGRSENKHWPGGAGVVAIEGSFLTGNGVSTMVSLNHQTRQNDGSYSRVAVVKEFQEPGEYQVSMSPGLYFFRASGPDGSPWSISATIKKAPNRNKRPTTEQRLRALESKRRKR